MHPTWLCEGEQNQTGICFSTFCTPPTTGCGERERERERERVQRKWSSHTGSKCRHKHNVTCGSNCNPTTRPVKKTQILWLPKAPCTKFLVLRVNFGLGFREGEMQTLVESRSHAKFLAFLPSSSISFAACLQLLHNNSCPSLCSSPSHISP